MIINDIELDRIEGDNESGKQCFDVKGTVNGDTFIVTHIMDYACHGSAWIPVAEYNRLWPRVLKRVVDQITDYVSIEMG